MKTFVYIAKDSGGSEVRGKVKAENRNQAIANIRANDLCPIALGVFVFLIPYTASLYNGLSSLFGHENEGACRKPNSHFLKSVLAAIGKKLIEMSER